MQVGSRRILYAACAVATILILASVVIHADAYSGLSGKPTGQRATAGAW